MFRQKLQQFMIGRYRTDLQPACITVGFGHPVCACYCFTGIQHFPYVFTKYHSTLSGESEIHAILAKNQQIFP